MKIPLNFGGGGGSGSDDCTATASDILTGKTAIYNGSDDEPMAGTMKDYSGTTTVATVTNDSSNSRVTMTIPNTGKYDSSAKLYNSYSTVASTVGLTAAKIATGNTIMGIAGTYTGLGSATQAQVLSGKTFSTASLSNASGTMTDKSGTSTAATSSTSSSNVRLLVPANGYYNTSAYLTNSYSNLASTIGLTAAKLKYGESVLGLTGTWNGLVISSTDIYNAGTWGVCGTANFANTYITVTFTKSSDNIGVKCAYSSSSFTAGEQGLIFPTALNACGYSSLKMKYTVSKASTYASRLLLRIYWTTPSYTSTAAGFVSSDLGSRGVYTDMSSKTAGSTYTMSMDITGISQNIYVTVAGSFDNDNGNNSNGNYTATISRIWVE